MNHHQFCPGDHVSCSCRTHSHHGIYCGNVSYRGKVYQDVVIHFEGKHKRGQIRGVSYKRFAQGHDVGVVEYKKGLSFPQDTVVRRAINKLGDPDYNLFGNNCEHFAHWCKTGRKVSNQVNGAMKFAAQPLVGGVVGGGVALVVPAAPLVAIVSVSIIASKVVSDFVIDPLMDKPDYLGT